MVWMYTIIIIIYSYAFLSYLQLQMVLDNLWAQGAVSEHSRTGYSRPLMWHTHDHLYVHEEL